MIPWKHKLHLSDIFYKMEDEEDPWPFEKLRDEICLRIIESNFASIRFRDSEFEDILIGLKGSTDIDEFNDWWDDFYDWCDYDKRVWIETF